MINKINKEIESSDYRLNRMEKQANKLVDEIKEIVDRNSIYDIITFIDTPLNRLKELNTKMNAEDDKRRMLEFMLNEEEK